VDVRIAVLIGWAILLWATRLQAEVVNGPVELRQGKTDKPLAILVDKSRVESEGSDGKWEHVWFTAIVDAPALTDDQATVKAGQVLTGADGQKCATTTVAFPVEAERVGDRFRITVAGVVPKGAIRPESTVEYGLLQIVKSKKHDVGLADLEAHLKEFKYEPWFDQGDMTSYYVYENRDGGGRVMLILYKERLVLVILSRRNSALGALKPKPLFRGWGMVYIQRPGRDVQKQIEDYYFGILRKAS
jgi:hypothetical protein